MEGIALMLSSICFNATFCPNQQASTAENYRQFLPRDLERSQEIIENDLKKLAAEIKGQTLTIATLEDYPLSYIERNSSDLVGAGWAFEFFDTLARRFDFKYNIVKPRYNIIGASNDTEGSLMQMVNHSVSKFV